jgi:large subunit ribosomal protein L25
MEVNLKAQPRSETGKGPAHRVRVLGKVPAVLYGPSVDPVSLLVDAKEFRHALATEAGANVLINLQVEGANRFLTVAREVQVHPVRGTILHIDFVNISRDVKIHAVVPIHPVGESRGVKEGGELDVYIHELHLEALPADVPDAIEVDVSSLGIGDGLKAGELKLPNGVELLSAADDLVLQVNEPIGMKAVEEEAGEAEGGEESAEAEE